MYVTVVGMGFQKKVALSADATIADLKKKLKDSGVDIDTFQHKSIPVEGDFKLKEDMTVVGLAKKQKINLG